MADLNISKVYLLHVPLENDYKHTLIFETAAAQQSYFQSRAVKSYTDFSYQRKDNIIRVPEQYDTVLHCNYVMYQNRAYSDKWFYAFITDIKYVNDDRTDIFIETDVLQTWHFDYEVKTSFIERMHVLDDEIGKHTIPEQLETGDYIANSKNRNNSLATYTYILGVTVDLNSREGDDGKFNNAAGGRYAGIYSGVKYYICNAAQLNRALKELADEGQSDAVATIFVCPSLFVDADGASGTYSAVATDTNVKVHDWAPGILGLEQAENYKPTTLNGYTPKNNKLFTYPYCYMLMSNNSGGGAVYKYELFKNPDNTDICPFKIKAAICPGFSVRLVPQYYNGIDENNEEGLNLGKYPICNWNTDVYTNWLTQNGVNIAISLGTAAAQVVGGLAMSSTGAGAMMGAGSVASGGLSIASTMGEIYSHSLQPPQAEGNINSGDVTFASGDLTFTAYQMSIKSEYARMIDDYFTMYGYKVNYMGVPVHWLRENFWYFKTIDVNIDGPIPANDMQKIKNCWDNGVTFWKNPENIGNYRVSNNITEN